LDRSFNYIISPEISEFRRFSPKLKIGVLASGKGTNFQELINLSEKGELDIDIKVLITNKDEAGCIKRAESKKIPHKIIRSKDFLQKEAFELEIVNNLKKYHSKFYGKKFFITGANGFLGKYFIKVITEINNAVDHENTIMTHDAGHPRDQIMPFYPATVPNSYIGWGKSTHLGYGLPLVIGAKIAHPEKFCVNFMGDTAFGLSGLDLETSVRSENPITTILLNNSTMGGYDHHMPIAMERYGAGNNTGSYTTIAEGLGAKGIYVTKPEEIVPAIKDAQNTNNDGQSALIEVITQQEGRFSRYYNDESVTGGKIIK